MMKNVKLDSFDIAILNAIQRNNLESCNALGDRIGLSASAVRRRIKQLHEQGVIAQDVSIIDSSDVGVKLVVNVSFGQESVEIYQAFDDHVANISEIKQAYHVSGETDYVLIVHGPDLSWYEEWSKATLMALPYVKRFSSQVVWSCKKFDTSVAL